jgi:hypothetical protein
MHSVGRRGKARGSCIDGGRPQWPIADAEGAAPSIPKDPTEPQPDADATGMHKGLTSYGDAQSSLFLRKAFIKGAGYTDAALERPVIGLTDTGGDNPCHGNMPQWVEAAQRGMSEHGVGFMSGSPCTRGLGMETSCEAAPR